MSELFREIEEDIRRERFDKLWQGFGKAMVGASVLVILVTIGVVVVQNNRQSKAMEHTTQFIKGTDRLNIEDYKGAVPIFGEMAADTSSSYYGLAMLRKAQAQRAVSDRDGATKTYQAMTQHDSVFGELAKMLLSSLAAPGADVLVEPARTSPFYFSQCEWRGWQLLQQGKKDEAVAQFVKLRNNVDTPFSMRERLTEVLQYIAPDKLQEKTAEKSNDKAPEKTPEKIPAASPEPEGTAHE